MKVLVVGGGGYIGSHCVRQLHDQGHCPIVLDNLCYGHREAVEEGIAFYEGNLGDQDFVREVLRKEQVDVVMHFAAFAYVGESVENPLKYYLNNVGNTINLLDSMKKEGVRKFVFSSTCATFGIPTQLPIHERLEQKPINPYGQTKLDVENLLKSLCDTGEFSCAVFRYFNAAGAHETGAIGEDHDPETHLIPLCFDVATGRREALKVFGRDYDTPDGTCLRDYLHVDDIAEAHIAVFDQLEEGGFHDYNLGTGTPSSVMDVIRAVEDVTSLKVTYQYAPRRPGDPDSLYADSSKARHDLGWVPRHGDLKEIVQTAWKWHRSHPEGFVG